MSARFLWAAVALAVTACAPAEEADAGDNAAAIGTFAEPLRFAEALRHLELGESAVLFVASPTYWNRSGLAVRASESYRFETVPTATWTDWFIRTDANGFRTEEAPIFAQSAMASLESERRLPSASWFALAGSLGASDEGAFVIGARATVRMAASGELTTFANDVPGYYENNRGFLLVAVTRVE